MNLFFTSLVGGGRVTQAVEDLKRENQQLRLARIANGAHPDYANGSPKDAEKGRRIKLIAVDGF